MRGQTHRSSRKSSRLNHATGLNNPKTFPSQTRSVAPSPLGPDSQFSCHPIVLHAAESPGSEHSLHTIQCNPTTIGEQHLAHPRVIDHGQARSPFQSTHTQPRTSLPTEEIYRQPPPTTFWPTQVQEERALKQDYDQTWFNPVSSMQVQPQNPLRTGETDRRMPIPKAGSSEESWSQKFFGNESLQHLTPPAEDDTVDPNGLEFSTCGRAFFDETVQKKHQRTHTRPFTCPLQSCRRHEKGLATSERLYRHILAAHMPPRSLFNPLQQEQFSMGKGQDEVVQRESSLRQHEETNGRRPNAALPHFSPHATTVLVKEACVNRSVRCAIAAIAENAEDGQLLQHFTEILNEATTKPHSDCYTLTSTEEKCSISTLTKCFALSAYWLRYNDQPEPMKLVNDPLVWALHEMAQRSQHVRDIVSRIVVSRPKSSDAEDIKHVLGQLRHDLDTPQVPTSTTLQPATPSLVEKPFTDSGYGSITAAVRVCDTDTQGSTSIARLAIRPHSGKNTRTLYSIETNEDLVSSRNYVYDLANDIYLKLAPTLGLCNWPVLSRALPELLKAFAVKIGHGGPSQANRNVMYFIHRQHRNIVNQLEALLINPAEDEQATHPRKDSSVMSLFEKMNMWDDNCGTPEADLSGSDLFEGVKDEDGETDPLVAQIHYNNLVLNSKEYDWFILTLRRDLSLQWFETTNNLHMPFAVRHKILEMIPSGTISKRRAPRHHRAVFRIPAEHFRFFFTHQGPLSEASISGDVLLSDHVVLISCPGGLQMTRVGDYVDRTWPVFGKRVVNLLQETARGVYGYKYDCELPDQTSLSAILDNCFFWLELTGTAYSIALCGEEVGWLTAAMVHSDNVGTYTTPVVDQLDWSNPYLGSNTSLDSFQTGLLAHVDGTQNLSLGIIGIQFNIWAVPLSADQQHVPGWYQSFGYPFAPSIVQGYPTPRRSEELPGIEMPFDLLLKAAGSQKAENIGKSARIQGHNFTFELLFEVQDVFYWHILYQYPSCSCPTEQLMTGTADDRGFLRLKQQLSVARHVITPCKTSLEKNEDEIYSTSRSSASGCFEVDLFSTSSESVNVKRKDVDGPGFRFFMALFRRILKLYLRGMPVDCGSDDRKSTSQPSQTVSTAQNSSTLSNSDRTRKRRPEYSEGAGDGQDGLPPQKRSNALRSRSQEKSKFIACPFWKSDPDKHWDCFLYQITTIGYVKQHLSRKHTPALYCPTCFAIFDDDGIFDEHAMSRSCVRNPLLELEGISLSQRRRLSRKSKGTVEEQWYSIWQILFPGQPNPTSIYVDADQSRDFAQVREYQQNYGSAILRDHVRDEGFELMPGVSEPVVQSVLARGLDSIFEYYRLNRSSNSSSSTSLRDVRMPSAPTSAEALTDQASADSGFLPSLPGSYHGTHAGDLTVTMPSGQNNGLTSMVTQSLEPSGSLLATEADMAMHLETRQGINLDIADRDLEVWRQLEHSLVEPDLDGLLDAILSNGTMTDADDGKLEGDYV